MKKLWMEDCIIRNNISVSHLDYIGPIRMNLPGKGRSIMRISKDVWSRLRIMIYLCLLPVY